VFTVLSQLVSFEEDKNIKPEEAEGNEEKGE
jgi:hypothetical protein